jgi:GNAT superfamily N-acetyltransferase
MGKRPLPSGNPLMVTIRPACKADIPAIVRAWQVSLPYDEIAPHRLEAFFESPAYDPNVVLLAESEEGVGALVIGVAGPQKVGYVPVFFVHPSHAHKDMGDHLLSRVLAHFGTKGLKSVKVEPFHPRAAFFTGIDRCYGELLGIPESNGFRRTDESQVDIVKDLTDYQMPDWVCQARLSLEHEGITFCPCGPGEKQTCLEFLMQRFPGYKGWIIDTERFVAGDGLPEKRMLAFCGAEMIGFVAIKKWEHWQICQTGVRKDFRLRKIGSVLVHLALEEAPRDGETRCYVYNCPIEFYRVLDGAVFRRYVMLGKELV